MACKFEMWYICWKKSNSWFICAHAAIKYDKTSDKSRLILSMISWEWLNSICQWLTIHLGLLTLHIYYDLMYTRISTLWFLTCFSWWRHNFSFVQAVFCANSWMLCCELWKEFLHLEFSQESTAYELKHTTRPYCALFTFSTPFDRYLWMKTGVQCLGNALSFYGLLTQTCYKMSAVKSQIQLLDVAISRVLHHVYVYTCKAKATSHVMKLVCLDNGAGLGRKQYTSHLQTYNLPNNKLMG